MFWGRDVPPFPVVSQVKYLESVATDMEYFSMFLDSLALPVVQELRIDMRQGRLPRSSLISLVSRSGCSLQRLALTKCFCHAAELLALFLAIPSLAKLEVNDCPISGNVVLQLLDLSMNASATTLPNLQALKLVDQRGTNLSDLANMVLSRWRHNQSSDSGNRVARLSSITLVFDSCNADVSVLPPNADPEAIPLLRQLIAKGLEMSILNRHRDTFMW
jgi:hypothetical protein